MEVIKYTLPINSLKKSGILKITKQHTTNALINTPKKKLKKQDKKTNIKNSKKSSKQYMTTPVHTQPTN